MSGFYVADSLSVSLNGLLHWQASPMSGRLCTELKQEIKRNSVVHWMEFNYRSFLMTWFFKISNIVVLMAAVYKVAAGVQFLL